MEKTRERRNLITYIAELIRSFRDSSKVLVAEEVEDAVEGLDAIDETKLSTDDAKIVSELRKSEKNIDVFVGNHKSFIDSIDYSQKKGFRDEVKTTEGENIPVEEEPVISQTIEKGERED